MKRDHNFRLPKSLKVLVASAAIDDANTQVRHSRRRASVEIEAPVPKSVAGIRQAFIGAQLVASPRII